MVSLYKRRRKIKLQTRSALELIEETLYLLRNRPARLLLPYYLGTVPFILAFMYFWADMSRDAFAQQHCAKSALMLAVLFVWMKYWQSVFCTRLHRLVTLSGTPRPTVWQTIRRIAYQTIIHCYGIIILTLALLVAIPFPAAYAFFQNALSCADGQTAGLGRIIKQTLRISTSDTHQNMIMMWLLCPWILGTAMAVIFGAMHITMQLSPHDYYYLERPFWFFISLVIMYYIAVPFSPLGCVLSANFAVLIVMLPMAASALLGIDSSFTLIGIHGITNFTFLSTVFALTFLIMDPVMKAAYVVRRFYIEARTNGADLLLELEETIRQEDAA